MPMKTEKLNYTLPPGRIAQHPAARRTDAQLLVFERSTGRLTDSRFSRLPSFFQPGDCLVFNDTKVIPARFFARRATGAQLQGLFLHQIDSHTWKVMLRNARRLKQGETIGLLDRKNPQRILYAAQLLEKTGTGNYLLRLDGNETPLTILGRIGYPPLPPYIKRDTDAAAARADKKRYQTVYARRPGAVAAPTAGLHFTHVLINQLKQTGINFANLTLHVSAGTFKPVTTPTIEQHKIHHEQFRLNSHNAKIINRTKAQGDRIIAVGTTSVRTLETLAAGTAVKPAAGDTNLFIKPGYKFKIVDAMVTNFHLPKSTLLALVAAFAGLDNILGAYRHAIDNEYRFYSYGDAMLIL